MSFSVVFGRIVGLAPEQSGPPNLESRRIMTETIKTLIEPIQERLDRRDHLVESGEYRRAVTRCDDTESVAALSHPHPSRVRTERQYAPTYVSHLEALADKVPSLLAAVQAVLVVCEEFDDVAKLSSAIPGTKSFQSNRIRAAVESALTEAR